MSNYSNSSRSYLGLRLKNTTLGLRDGVAGAAGLCFGRNSQGFWRLQALCIWEDWVGLGALDTEIP